MAKCANQSELTRDVYGFTVRPQHLKRYKEYAIIYEEEETERSTRWEQFLNTYCDESIEAGHYTKRADCHTKENEGSRKSKTWNEIRPRLYPVEKALKYRFRNIHVRKDNGSLATVAGLVETTKSSGHGDSEDESDDEFYDVERSDVMQDSHSSTDASADESDGDKVDEESACPWKEELDALVRGGVPMAMRGELWQIFTGASTRRVLGHYEAILSLLTDENGDSNGSGGFTCNATSQFKISDRCIIEKWANQIEKDLPRTFPGHPALDEDGRNALRYLLTAYARHNPNVGYCQAMNFFAGLLLLMMPEENAFWTLAGILDDCFEGYYSEKMLESQVDQLVLEELLREHFPRLMSHLDALGVQVAWVTGPWFLSIFVNIFPWETVLRVWDVLLYEGDRSMLFRTTLALMELYGTAIIATKDAGDVVTTLQSFAASTFDSSQLVLTACVAYQSINESQLQELREKYRPQVLAKFSGRSIDKATWHKACGPSLFSSESETTDAIKHQKDSCQPVGALSTALDGDLKDSHEYTSVNNGSGKIVSNDDMFSEEENNGNRVFDLAHQVKRLKLELSKALEERQAANLRAEELETAFMELVKEDNRRLLAAKIETLEAEVAYLKRTLKEKMEQEQAMIQVMVRMEHEQKVTEDARRFAEEDAKRQRELMNALEVKYNAATASIKELEKRTAMAESMLDATLQYQSLNNGLSKQSPTSAHSEESSWRSWSWTASRSADPDGISVTPTSKLDGADNGNVRNSNDASQNQGLLMRRLSLSWKDIVKGKIGSPQNSQSEVADQKPQVALTSPSFETPVPPSLL